MKKIFILLIIAILFLSVFIGIYPIKNCDASGATIYVDDSGGQDYTVIQNAIDNASAGDTIYIYSGMYKESITIEKQIRLIGENNITSIINGADIGNAIHIKNVQGIEIRNLNITAGRKYLDDTASFLYSGIRLGSVSHSIIDNCIITNCTAYAIYYEFSGRDCHNITISNNVIYGEKGGINKGSYSVDNKLINNVILDIEDDEEDEITNQDNDDENSGTSNENEEPDSSTPGFQLILFFCVMILIIIWSKKKKGKM